MQRIEMRLFGRVQNVCFRMFIRDNAIKLGLKGYVRNVDTDKVEIVAEGPEKELKELIERAKIGPPASHVSKHNVNFFPPTNDFDRFSIRY
jgi:acylphosphatase